MHREVAPTRKRTVYFLRLKAKAVKFFFSLEMAQKNNAIWAAIKN